MFKTNLLFKSLTIIGVLLVISCSPKKQLTESKAVNPPNIRSSNSLTNPFTFDDLGVPYGFGWCGTVMPGATLQLNADEAKAVINKVYEDEEIKLQKDYVYEKDSVKVVLDGFDPELKIGYIWVGAGNIGKGILMLWDPHYYDDVLAYNRVPTLDIATFEGILDETAEEKSDKAWHQRFEAAKKMTNEEEKLQAYRALYLDDMLEFILNSKDDPTFEYISTYLNDLNAPYEEKQKIYTRSLLIEACQGKINRFEKKNILEEIIYEIIHLEDEKERKYQYNNFGTFLIKNVTDEQREAQQKVLANPDKATIANEIQKLGINYSNQQLSMREARYLENIDETEGDFIAMIGMRDKRFTYRSAGLKRMEKIKIREERGQEGINEVWEEEEKRAKEDHAKALKSFETQVRQYIQWAKQ